VNTFLHQAGKCWLGQQQAKLLVTQCVLRCNETLFNFDGALHPMKAIQRRTFAFDTRSVMLFAAVTLGGGGALHAQTAPGAAPKVQGGSSFGPAASSSTFITPPGTASATTAAFDRADANADDKLSADEAATMPPIGNRFEQLDADHDGSLSRTEFDKGAR
jgi:hypothetical protein